MAVSQNVRVFNVPLGEATANIFAPLAKNTVISGAAQTRLARNMRQRLILALRETVIDAFRSGPAPVRTGGARARMLAGARAFGKDFASLRGHIIGPGYIKAHEDGAKITPKESTALAVPLAPALRADGTPKLPGPRSWQNVQRTFIFKSKKTQNSFIAFENAAGGLTFLYILLDLVQLRKNTGFIANAWDRNKLAMMADFGRFMMIEISRVDLPSIARVTSSGRGRGRR